MNDPSGFKTGSQGLALPQSGQKGASPGGFTRARMTGSALLCSPNRNTTEGRQKVMLLPSLFQSCMLVDGWLVLSGHLLSTCHKKEGLRGESGGKGGKGRRSQGGKGLRGERGERISTGRGGENILGRKREKISEGERALGGKGGMDLNRERGAKILEGKGGKGTIPKGRK